MQVSLKSWHMRLFAQAYIRDRYWADMMIEMPLNFRKDLSEFEREKYWADVKERFSHRKAFLLSERLKAGHVSICPYFWSVVWALFAYSTIKLLQFVVEWLIAAPIYYVIIWPIATFIKMVRDYLKRQPKVRRFALNTLIASLLIVLLGGVSVGGTYLVTQAWDNYRAEQIEQARYQADQARWQKEADLAYQREVAERQAWERAHPEEVKRLKQEQATAQAEELAAMEAQDASEAEYQAEQARLREQERIQFWQGLPKNIGVGLIWLTLAVLTGLSAYACYLAGAEALAGLRSFLNRMFPKADREPRPVPESIMLLHLALIIVREGFAFVWRLIVDTVTLVYAFGKAKKERFCVNIEVRELA